MRQIRERALVFGSFVVLLLCSVLTVRQVLQNQSKHAELREAFIYAHSKGMNSEAERLYNRLKFDMPDEPTRHLIDDLVRTTPITPTNQSPVTNVLVRYHLWVKKEVGKRVEQDYLRKEEAAEPNN
jgi:hypothetical protein